jgi:preprotein translocase subunit SecD
MSANISKATKKPAKSGRTLALLAVIVIAFGAIAIFQGDTKLKLGLDLRGGTSVTLAPKVAAGGKIDKAAVDQAVAIIRQRVNSLGVAESEVSSQSNGDIIVSVPGNSSSRVVDLVGATAQLRFREVLAVGFGQCNNFGHFICNNHLHERWEEGHIGTGCNLPCWGECRSRLSI